MLLKIYLVEIYTISFSFLTESFLIYLLIFYIFFLFYISIIKFMQISICVRVLKYAHYFEIAYSITINTKRAFAFDFSILYFY